MPDRDHNLIDSGDHMVTAERSMFGTRLPRPTGVGRHLVIVIVVCAVTLGIAIWFAERPTDETTTTSPAQTTKTQPH